MNSKLKFLIGFILLVLGVVSYSFSSFDEVMIDTNETTTLSKTETFTFSSNGTTTKGKIFLPASYETNKNLPAIYLIDFTEQHFKLATDEFEKVIDGVQRVYDSFVNIKQDGI